MKSKNPLSILGPRLNQSGFSLVEIMVVIALLGMVMTFVVTNVLDRMDEGKQGGAKIQISTFKSMLEDYRRYCNQYPTTEQGLDALVSKPTNAPDCPSYPASGFINGKLPVDPWQKPYNYESDGEKYVITSLGKDGKEGGEKYSADIKSTDL